MDAVEVQISRARAGQASTRPAKSRQSHSKSKPVEGTSILASPLAHATHQSTHLRGPHYSLSSTAVCRAPSASASLHSFSDACVSGNLLLLDVHTHQSSASSPYNDALTHPSQTRTVPLLRRLLRLPLSVYLPRSTISHDCFTAKSPIIAGLSSTISAPATSPRAVGTSLVVAPACTY